MKLNLKSTIAAPAGNKSLNGIIGNTKRGIRVDQTLDPDSNNPVANKPVSTALAALAGKIDAALQKPTGLTKTKLVGVGTSGQENIEIGDNLTLEDGKLAAVGCSISPTLNLIDFENGGIRISITEEEYNNLKNGLYNSVNYYTEVEYDTYLPSKLFSIYDDSDESLVCIFSSIKITGTSETDVSLTNIIYELNIGEKDASGNYPITIEKKDEFPLGSGGGSSASSDSMHVIVKKETNGKITLTEAEFDNLAKDDYELAVTNGTSLLIYDEKEVTKDSSTGNVYSIGFTCTIVRTMNQLVLMNTYGVEFARDNLVSNIVTYSSLMTQSKLFNKKVMTYNSYSPENILPCTASDNGKVLSVVNGEAQWASASGGITVTFED